MKFKLQFRQARISVCSMRSTFKRKKVVTRYKLRWFRLRRTVRLKAAYTGSFLRTRPSCFTFSNLHVKLSLSSKSVICKDCYYKPQTWPNLPWKGFTFTAKPGVELRLPTVMRLKNKNATRHPRRKQSRPRVLGKQRPTSPHDRRVVLQDTL